MRIDELTFPKSKEAAGAILFKCGYRRIGARGGFGSVYHKEGETTVVKLFSNRDKAYREFVDFCRTVDNPHFPKFSRSAVILPNTDYSAVRTEFLTEFTSLGLDWINGLINYFNVSGDPIAAEVWFQEQMPSFQEACERLRDWISRTHFTNDIGPRNLMMRGDTVVFSDPVTISLANY